jgi:hypothetical protein
MGGGPLESVWCLFVQVHGSQVLHAVMDGALVISAIQLGHLCRLELYVFSECRCLGSFVVQWTHCDAENDILICSTSVSICMVYVHIMNGAHLSLL